jgi:hypothetical protein
MSSTLVPFEGGSRSAPDTLVGDPCDQLTPLPVATRPDGEPTRPVMASGAAPAPSAFERQPRFRLPRTIEGKAAPVAGTAAPAKKPAKAASPKLLNLIDLKAMPADDLRKYFTEAPPGYVDALAYATFNPNISQKVATTAREVANARAHRKVDSGK